MKKLISFLEYMTEKKKGEITYEYGCSMLFFSFPEIEEIHKSIKREDLYEEDNEKYGLERESHCTLLYGIHCEEVEDDEVLSRSNFKIGDFLILKNISFFDNKEYDVLKFEVIHPELREINSRLSELPHTNEYKYNPHCTIAYIKKGRTKKYIDQYQDKSFKVWPTHIVYSKNDGTKIKFDLK